MGASLVHVHTAITPIQILENKTQFICEQTGKKQNLTHETRIYNKPEQILSVTVTKVHVWRAIYRGRKLIYVVLLEKSHVPLRYITDCFAPLKQRTNQSSCLTHYRRYGLCVSGR